MPWATRRSGHRMNPLTLTPFYNWTCFVNSPQNGRSPISTGHYKTLSKLCSEGFLSYVFSLYFCVSPRRFGARRLFQPPLAVSTPSHLFGLPFLPLPCLQARTPTLPCQIRNPKIRTQVLSPVGLQSGSKVAPTFAPPGFYDIWEVTDENGELLECSMSPSHCRT